jgi:Protein of unknown function (DUF1207)
MNRRFIALLACAWMPHSYSAENTSEDEGKTTGRLKLWTLENRSYYDPLLAEPRAAQVTAIVYANSSEFEYQVEPGRRQTWDISLGKEIPLLGFENCGFASNTVHEGCTGFGLWLPVSFHMIEDFKDASSPIINTDFRFSLLAKVQKVFESGSLAARVQVGHESTHLGDEFTIHAEDTYGSDFERVNVTYEYWEYGLSYETVIGDEHIVTFRHGGIGLLNNKKGFYGTKLLGSETDSLTPSTKHFEPTFGFQWQKESKIPKSWEPLASVDLRLKTVYNYHRPPNTSDKQQWTVSALFGFRHGKQRTSDRGAPIIVGRVYYGVNPHGQFRNQDNYFQWGVGLIVPL